MKLVRKIHLWLGMLFAPSILFFAFSGSLQLFGLHEDGSEWIARLALIHKDQLATVPSRPPRPAQPEVKRPPDSMSPAPARPPRERPHPSMPLKVFFLLMSVGLISSTGLGIYLAFGYRRDRVTILALLAAGTAIPIVALFL